MTVSHEIKSQLAKLLATEDLVVEHKKVETACFNVHTRVLTLPMWEKASGSVYDMLVGHEVGHALYTPDRDWIKERKISPQIVNVVEDVRIEKLMKRRYAGISKTFYRGYSELAEEDFFQIADENLDIMNLADKANLYFKIGSFVDINFDEKERILINKIANTETFDDVLDVAEELYNFCKQEQKEKETNCSQNQNGQEGESENTSDEQSGQQTGHSDPQNQSQSKESESQDSEESESEDNTNEGGDVEVSTVSKLEDAIKELVSHDGYENVYIELPKLDLKKIIVPNAEIHERCEENWSSYEETQIERMSQFPFMFNFSMVDEQYSKFKRSAQKEVNYLVKEFECKKAADSYARATTARTGVLDCSKLHTYKYNEDLFKKVTTLAEGKNHGLVFVLDWSGSMGNVMIDTLKQLFNLVWFCKKVNIPFEVYAFTNEYPLMDEVTGLREFAYKKKAGLAYVPEWFSMMNFLTSKVNAKVLDQQMKNLFRIAYSFQYHCAYNTPVGMGLSGTPLNEAMISLHQILPQFKEENKLQKVQCVVLTDGEGCSLRYHREMNRGYEDGPFLGTGSIAYNCVLRDRKTGNTYSCGDTWDGMTDVLLRNLRDNFVDMNFIGIRILDPRDGKSFIRRYYKVYTDEYTKVETAWKKKRAFSIKTSGYHSYFGLSSSALNSDGNFEVRDDATKSQIKSAFAKSLNSKKMNKKILGEFISLVA